MKNITHLLLTLVVGSLFSPFISSSALAASTVAGANLAPDAVLTWDNDAYGSGTYYDQTADALDSGDDDVLVLTDEDDALYFGSTVPFDGIAVEFTTPLEGSDAVIVNDVDGRYTLEYWNGEWIDVYEDVQSELSVIIQNYDLDDNSDSGVFVKTWIRTTDWTVVSPNREPEEYYYVRLRISQEYSEGNAAYAAEAGLIDYNLKIVVRDEFGNSLSGMTEDDFLVEGSSGADDTVYHFEEMEEGQYGFALDVPTTSGSEYTLSVYPEGFVGRDDARSGIDLSFEQYVYEAEDYAYSHRLRAQNETGETVAITSAYAGDSDVACVIDDGEAYCPVKTSDDSSGATATVTAEAYVESTQEIPNRSSATDAQVITTFTLEKDEETNPDQDSDGDGLTNAQELTYGTDENDVDTDNDDIWDAAEVYDETDPLNSDDFLADGQDYYLTCSDPFVDTIGHWAEKSICLLYDAGIVEGRSSNYYEPSAYITRAEFLKIALLNAGFTVTEDDDTVYSDVAEEDWYFAYVTYATSEGYVEGYDDGTFRPNAMINRAEAMTIVMRIAGAAKYNVNQSDVEFVDVDDDAWYAWAIVRAEDDGIIEGYADETFRPDNSITRAEVAVIARRAWYVYYE